MKEKVKSVVEGEVKTEPDIRIGVCNKEDCLNVVWFEVIMNGAMMVIMSFWQQKRSEANKVKHTYSNAAEETTRRRKPGGLTHANTKQWD